MGGKLMELIFTLLNPFEFPHYLSEMLFTGVGCLCACLILQLKEYSFFHFFDGFFPLSSLFFPCKTPTRRLWELLAQFPKFLHSSHLFFFFLSFCMHDVLGQFFGSAFILFLSVTVLCSSAEEYFSNKTNMKNTAKTCRKSK